MRRLLFSFVMILAGAASQSFATVNEDFTHHRFSISGTLTSSDTYSLEAAYHYMFWEYLGIGGALGHWSNWYDDGWASGTRWHIDDDDNKPSNLYLRPSVVVTSPALKWRQAYLSIYAEPGLMLNIPYQRVCIETTENWPAKDYDYISTTGGQWLAMDLRLGINANVGPCGISAGYMMSNLDIFSQYRHLSYRGISFREFYHSKPFMQGAYLTLSYNF